MSWIKRLLPSIKTRTALRHTIPEGIWTKCSECNSVLYRTELERNLEVCPKCAHHMHIGARARLKSFLEPEPWQEIGANISPVDILKFRDSKKYKDRLVQAQKNTEENEGLIVIKGQVRGIAVVACAFEFHFMGGSMGSVVGERFVLAVEAANESAIPLVCFSSSGGARMQESLFSLMQMAKTSSALSLLKRAGIPYISILTNPTMGGVSASIASLGDVNIAEPKALIGFAGPRVIEQTVGTTLPEGFQRSEFLLEHGDIDIIIDRRELRDRIASLLSVLLRQSIPSVKQAAV